MARQLKNANITHVSYVNSAANKKQFLLTKSLEKQPDFEKRVEVIIDKSDEKQLVYGVVYEPDVEDAHGDYMDAEDIEKAAHEFMKVARNIDTNHDFEAGVGEVVESYIAPADFDIDGEKITKGTWLMVTKASDEVWESIKKGDITGYSMAGTAEVIEKQVEQPPKPSVADERTFIEKVKDAVGEALTKGVVRDYYDRGKKRRNVYAALGALEESLYDHNYNDFDMEKLKADANEFVELINEISYEDLQKSLKEYKEINEEDDEMNAEELAKVVKAAVAEEVGPLKNDVAALKKEPETNEEGSEEITAEVIKSVVEKAVKEGIDPIKEDVEKLKKNTKSSNRLDDEEIQKQNESDDVFGSLFTGGNQ